MSNVNGFRLGFYVFKDAGIVDFAAPHGVFAVSNIITNNKKALT